MLMAKPFAYCIKMLSFLALVFISAACGAKGKDNYNVVLILTDDQRYDELGFLNPEIDTPHIDKLANEGVFFHNAFVTTSLCSPSRASILTGQYAHAHGIVDNLVREISPGTVFFPQWLQQSGYQTAFIGKWHMGRHSDDPQPGFDHWVSFAGQGNYLPKQGSKININGKRVDQKGYITDELTDYALEWLASIDTSHKFFLYLSHKAVHDNFTPAERHKTLYSDRKISLPKSAEDTPQNYEGKPMWVKNQRNSWHGVDFPYHSDLDVREYKRNYHRALAAVDDSVGSIRSMLTKMGVADNTIILFMGDNGFMFGEHGLIDKRNAYEESMRIPLIVHGPGILAESHEVNDMVANIDIAPTILELTNTKATAKMHGLSFARQLKGEPVKDWRTELLYEYFWEWVFPHTPTTYAVRTDQYKLIQYHGIWDTDELYDLENDPQEMNNLINRSEYKPLVRKMREKLFRLIQSTDGTPNIPFTMKQGPGLHFRSMKGGDTAVFPRATLRTGNERDLDSYKD